jgi:hypothetical protein
VGLERGPLSLVSTIEKLLGRNSSGSGLENREYGCGNPLRWPRDTLYQLKLALTSPTGSGRSVGIVRLRTKDTVFVCLDWIQVILATIHSVTFVFSFLAYKRKNIKIYKIIILPVVLYGCETWSLALREEDWRCLRARYWEHVDRRGMQLWVGEENSIMRSFITGTLRQI